MSDLELNLNEPNKLGDVSWVHPSKFVGVWWSMHLQHTTWNAGPKHGANTANTKKYIDFAAQNGFRGVLVEGWNQGWESDWGHGGADFSFTKPYPDFDLPALAAYAKEKGVRLIGHHETGGNLPAYEKQMDAAYKLYAKLGVDSVKSGYVHEAGSMQFQGRTAVALRPLRFAGRRAPLRESRDGSCALQDRRRHPRAGQGHRPAPHLSELDVARRRARRRVQRLGQSAQRRRPRSQAGVHAHAERPDGLHAGHPQPGGRGRQGVQLDPGQAARQLRRHLFADRDGGRPAGELREVPGRLQVHRDVPTDWAETRVINGAVGEYASIARKDRKSEDWYVGAVTDGRRARCRCL
jgi:alpha-glucosidase